DRELLSKTVRSNDERATLDLALVASDPAGVISRATSLLLAPAASPELKLLAARLLQLSVGDIGTLSVRPQVFEGYAPRSAQQLRARGATIPPCVRAIFPTGHAALDRELSRLLAMIECDDSALRERVAAQLTRNSGPAEDIHYLTVLARMRGSLPARLTEK